ncbi:Methyltransferase domain-containing protein [Lentzea albidocapillata subsp. violacea]|uniref:Methyltransferase domain-containing protein n=1 Tax=Lentzea albidocapillata subsp. violacea TaxID=128104 RepID=A0A1G9IQZ7_9PSEU|nr:class I SAM-dependent methyltransferase [Lentzea albidocapillata]SDL27597.1 Methyltransferase domain-containing protein [Lentzea albidocapillata subsp. violacea]
MSTKWKEAVAVATGFDAYDDLPERLIGYPAVFASLGIGTPEVRTVLDYGCGPGKVANRVVQASDARVVAADISPHMLEIARQDRPHPRIDYHQIDSGRLEFLSDSTVDAAMSCYVFINIGDLQALHDIAGEVHRVLRPGGRYAVLDTNPGTTGVRFSTFRSGEPGRDYATGERRQVLLDQPRGGVLELIDHHWPRQTYLDVLSAAGFRDITVREPLLDPADASSGGPAPAEATRSPFLVVTGVK